MEVRGVQPKIADGLGRQRSALEEFVLRFVEIVFIWHQGLCRRLVNVQDPRGFTLDEQHYFGGVGSRHQEKNHPCSEDRADEEQGNQSEAIGDDPPTIP